MRAKQMASLGMAVLLAAATPAAVYASTDITEIIDDGGNHVIEGNIDYSGDGTALDVGTDGTSVTVKGDVRSENSQSSAVITNEKSSLNVGRSIESVKGNGVETNGGSHVSVGKNISSGKTGIVSNDESTVKVSGNVASGGTGIISNTTSKAEIKGDIESGGTGAESKDRANITVNGNIESGGTGIDADGSSSVGVKGNVESGGTGIVAKDRSTVTVDGNVESDGTGIDAKDFTHVTVKGDVISGDNIGIKAAGGADITVGGSVKVKNGGTDFAVKSDSSGSIVKAGSVDTDTAGIAAGTGGTIIIDGDVESGSGRRSASLLGDSVIVIGGDIRTKDNGEIIIVNDNYGYDNKSELVIEGKIDNTDGLTIKVKTDQQDHDKLINFAETVVGEITDTENIKMYDVEHDMELSDAVKEKVLDNIKYIVRSDPDSMEGKGAFTITKLNGDSLSKDKSGKYDVASRTEQILVRISVSEGYEVGSFSAGRNNTYVRNADGSYTVTVADGGGINIAALIKAIERDPDPVRPAPIDSGSGSSSGSSNRGGSTHTRGTWSGSGAGMTFTKADGSPARNEWVEINVNGRINRYFFDADGKMTTGWYTDASGSRYYLNETSGSDYGAMCTGWKLIDGRWYYLMPYTTIMSGIKRNAGSMMRSAVTPDGYKVDADGVWVEK